MNAVVRLNPLLLHLTVPLAAGALTSRLSGNPGEVYRSLILPGFAPPAAIFVVVWTALYLLMGTASYLVADNARLSRGDRRSALMLYGFALLTNLLWSILFFRFRLLTFGACWIVVVLAVTALCAAVFYRIRPAAGLLLVPVLVWMLFALVLNICIVVLN